MDQLKAYQEKFIENKFGYCCYAFDQDCNTSKEGNEIKGEIYAIIYNLFVYPEYRRQGKARDLLKSVINAIRLMDYLDEIKIEANPRENSISLESLVLFYMKMGLKVCNQTT